MERYHGPSSRVQKDAMDLLLAYENKYHGPISKVQKDTMGQLLEYRKIPWA
jgi:hypothetical protein